MWIDSIQGRTLPETPQKMIIVIVVIIVRRSQNNPYISNSVVVCFVNIVILVVVTVRRGCGFGNIVVYSSPPSPNSQLLRLH